MRVRATALLVGKLGRASKLSLQSMLENFENVCVAVDLTAKRSLLEFAESQHLNPRKVFCFHEIPIELIEELGIIPEAEYSEFGKESFISLTTFKWFLLKSVLTNHSSLEYVLFSDLDVLWLNSNLEPYLDNTKQILIQDDSPIHGKSIHYCTGIMIWRNNHENLEILQELFKKQFELNKNKLFIPDEPIFNEYFSTSNNSKMVKLLPQDRFVIGHRFFSKFSKVDNFTAFHANYVIGDARKYLRLLAIRMKYNQNLTGYVLFIRELLIKVIEKLESLLRE